MLEIIANLSLENDAMKQLIEKRSLGPPRKKRGEDTPRTRVGVNAQHVESRAAHVRSAHGISDMQTRPT
jgi:hypothetical protein